MHYASKLPVCPMTLCAHGLSLSGVPARDTLPNMRDWPGQHDERHVVASHTHSVRSVRRRGLRAPSGDGGRMRAGHTVIAAHRSDVAQRAMPPWATVEASVDVVCRLHQRINDVYDVSRIDVVVVGIFHQARALASTCSSRRNRHRWGSMLWEGQCRRTLGCQLPVGRLQ